MSREVRRVPVDFDWPLNKVWSGYQRTDEERERWEELNCPDCTRGYAPRAQELHDLWYGYVPFAPEDNGSTPLTIWDAEVRAFAERNVQRDPWYYVGRGYGSDDPNTIERATQREARRLCDLWNGMWCHHLNQADVDALIEGGRLYDFTHKFTPETRWQPIDPPPVVTPEQVNRWSLRGFGHDSINAMIAVRARCEREGVPEGCPTCDGHASLERYPGQRAEAEAWEHTEPPTGEGWQLWETVTEGSPVSPVFATAEELAQWLTTAEGGKAAGTSRYPTKLSISAARKFVEVGSTPGTFVGDAGGLHNAVEYVGTAAVLKELEED